MSTLHAVTPSDESPAPPLDSEEDVFLSMDPDTGDILCVVREPEGVRALHAHELAREASPTHHQPIVACQPLLDWAMDRLDAFIQSYEQAYPELGDEASEWDLCPSPG